MSRHAKKIDTVHWAGAVWQFVGQTAGTAAQTLSAAQHLPETLLRMRGSWAANFNGALAPGVGVAVAMGIIQVPEGTGTTVLWSPDVDSDAPWIWWDTMHLLYSEQVTDVVGSVMSSAGRRVIDSKAMRKIRNTELQIVIEQSTISGMSAGSINSVGGLRVLSGS